MDHLDRLVMLIGCIAEVYMIFNYFHNFFELRKIGRTRLRIVLGSMFAICMLFACNIFGNAFVNLLSFTLILWIYISVLFFVDVGNRLVYFIVAFSIFWGCEFLFVVLLKIPTYFVIKTSYTEMSEMTWQLIAMKLLTYLFFVLVKQISNKSKKRMSGKVFGMYLCVPIASLGIMLVTYYTGMDFSNNMILQVMMTLCFSLMLLGNILIFYAFNRYSEELCKGMERDMIIMRQDIDLKYYVQLSDMNRKHDELIHNASHYLKAIGELAKAGRSENILNIVKELNIELENSVMIVYSEDHVLNVLLSEKCVYAEKKEVCVDVYVEPGTHMGKVTDSDLITMLGNLLDNAIRAAECCKENKNVKVRIFMQNEGSFCVIKVINGFVGEIHRKESGFLTTKKEKGLHGLGIKSVESTAEKYDGYLKCVIGDNEFEAVLVLLVC